MSRWPGLRKKLFEYMSVAQWIAFGAMMCISYIAVRHPELAASLATLRLGIMAAFFFAMLAVVYESFPLYCMATFFGGTYASVAQSYRFAAADTACQADAPNAL